MALTTTNYRETTATQSWYDSTFRSTYDLEFKPQTLGELIYRYGDGLSVLNFLHLGQRVMPVKSETIKVFEKGAPSRPVLVSISTSADASAGVTVTFASSDDSDDYVRDGMTLLVPKAYTNKNKDVEFVLSSSGAVWTGKPLQSGVQITDALSEVYCTLNSGAFGYGTAQPDPMATGSYSYTTKSRIFKESVGIEGASIFNEKWEEFDMVDGSKSYWTRSIGEMDFRLDEQIDGALLAGDANANTTNVKATSTSGNSVAIPSFNGLIAEMQSKAQELDWTTGFDIDKFRAVKGLLENVGIINKSVDFMVGTDLNASIETNMIDFLKTYSAGHSFYDVLNGVGFMTKTVLINGVNFHIAELSSFANPNRFGLTSYGYRDMGFMFPQGEYRATLDQMGAKQEMRLPHVTLGYPEGNGENRQRIFAIEPGVNGLQGTGNIVSNNYDGVKIHTLAHLVPIFTRMHQTILVEKDTTEGGGA